MEVPAKLQLNKTLAECSKTCNQSGIPSVQFNVFSGPPPSLARPPPPSLHVQLLGAWMGLCQHQEEVPAKLQLNKTLAECSKTCNQSGIPSVQLNVFSGPPPSLARPPPPSLHVQLLGAQTKLQLNKTLAGRPECSKTCNQSDILSVQFNVFSGPPPSLARPPPPSLHVQLLGAQMGPCQHRWTLRHCGRSQIVSLFQFVLAGQGSSSSATAATQTEVSTSGHVLRSIRALRGCPLWYGLTTH